VSAGGSDGSVLIGRGTRAAGNVPDLAWRPLLLVALALAGLLVAVSGRYGYHRDELYFLQAGRHLAWGYPDQPPFTPALTRLVTALAGSSLVALRLPSAIAAGAVVLMTGMLARELGGRRSAQVLAAAAMAASSLLMLVGHLTSTTTFDLVAWTALTLLTVKVLRTGEERLWLIAGAVAGVGLLNKTLLVLLLAALAAALVLAGPRARLASRWLWLGVLLTLLVWAPNLWWQARHGWPQLALNSAIAAGSSGSSEPRWLFLPYQLVLVSPLLVPVWVVGLVRLLRDPGLRWAHSLGVAYVLLVVVFLVADGKPYYICGLYPALLAAGAAPVLDWAARGRHRTALVSATVALAAGVSAVLMLPLVPADALHRTPIMAINYDAGETVGWPRSPMPTHSCPPRTGAARSS
jgi:4-amino-4-deoxy-L-arabinose transferase-like glycosyltransferase